MDRKPRFEDHLLDHLPQIRRIVRKISMDERVVDDITQECCARIIEKENLWSGNPETLKPWMNTVSRNLTFQLLAKEKKKRALPLNPEHEPIEEEPDFSKEQIEWVVNQFENLSPIQKKILHLKYFQDMRLVQISEELGISRQVVSYQLKQALKILNKNARSKGIMITFLPFIDFLKKRSQDFRNYFKGLSTLQVKGALTFAGLTALLLTSHQILSDSDISYNTDYLAHTSSVSFPQNIHSTTSTSNLLKNTSTNSIESFKNPRKPKPIPSKVIPDKYDVKKTYHPSGRIASETPYVNNTIHGIQRFYYDSPNEPLKSIAEFESGLVHGKIESYYMSGKIKEIKNCVQDELKGRQSIYYESGQLKSETYFLGNGHRDVFREFYPSGILKTELSATNQSKHFARSFHESGAIKLEENRTTENNSAPDLNKLFTNAFTNFESDKIYEYHEAGTAKANQIFSDEASSTKIYSKNGNLISETKNEVFHPDLSRLARDLNKQFKKSIEEQAESSKNK